MKIIALRGLPGSGKSFIAKKLAEKEDIREIINVDDFKIKFKKENPSSDRFEARSYAYKKTVERLGELLNKGVSSVIIEEVFNKPEFVKSINDFCQEKNIEIQWIYIKREMEKLLEIESQRERYVKNSREDFENLQKEIEGIKIPGEIEIENQGSTEDILNEIYKKESLENNKFKIK